MDCLYMYTYLGRIKNPEEVWILCKCLLDALHGAGDIPFGQRNDLESHCDESWLALFM